MTNVHLVPMGGRRIGRALWTEMGEDGREHSVWIETEPPTREEILEALFPGTVAIGTMMRRNIRHKMFT
jgi:hypothetical protein